MLNLNDFNAVRAFIQNEVMFANEAAKYLGISAQRLNQLVHAGKLTPVKVNRAGNLFLKMDLDLRKQELMPANVGVTKKRLQVNTSIIQEAVNYFAIQSLFKFSDKKAKPVFSQLGKHIDVCMPLIQNTKDVARLLELEESAILSAYESTLRGFEMLNEDDHVIKFGHEAYPKLLEKTDDAPPFLFMRGNIQLANAPTTVAVVGTRNPSELGEKRARKLGELLGQYNIVVASGLAKGIDTAAHMGALEANKKTVAVIGTPLTKVYPKENATLQHAISEKGLVISQFPPSSGIHRWHFPMRNAIMSGISLATVIVEAGETSGALIQANYAIKQGRLVFIPQSALENENLKWPSKYIQQPGAKKFSRIKELIDHLQQSKIIQHDNLLDKNFSVDNGVGVDYVSGGQ